MSLAEYQRAFSTLLMRDASERETILAAFALEEVERERLRRVLAHPGMRANRVLLRANRWTPLEGAFPLTCGWLREEMPQVCDAWMAAARDASMQYTREAAKFAVWLPEYFERQGRASHPALDALRYERALGVLAAGSSGSVELRFTYDPDEILDGWRAGARPLECPAAAHLCVRDGWIQLERFA